MELLQKSQAVYTFGRGHSASQTFQEGVRLSSFMTDQIWLFTFLRRCEIPYALAADRKRNKSDK
jgi:hypothetical protein